MRWDVNMKDDQGLTQLIGDIYDAALELVAVDVVLAKIAEYVGGQAAGLCRRIESANSATSIVSSASIRISCRLYSETYWKFDPVASLPDCEVEQVVSVPDLVSYEEFRAGRFYREWAQPQGWIDAANAVLEKSTNRLRVSPWCGTKRAAWSMTKCVGACVSSCRMCAARFAPARSSISARPKLPPSPIFSTV